MLLLGPRLLEFGVLAVLLVTWVCTCCEPASQCLLGSVIAWSLADSPGTHMTGARMPWQEHARDEARGVGGGRVVVSVVQCVWCVV